MKSRVTRNDVAERAGVSPAVVSYVLNNSNYVSAEKRAAVLKAAEELHYSPNVFAQSLRTNRSHAIALVGDSLRSELFGPLAHSLLNAGYYSSLFYAQRTDRFVQQLIDGRFEAVFMTSNGFSAAQLNRIADAMPMVLYRSRPYANLNDNIVCIAPDFYSGVAMQVQYLIDKGHTRIGYVPPLYYMVDNVNADDYRTTAYRDTLQKNGLPLNDRYVCTHTDSDQNLEKDIVWMLSMSEEVRPTAVITTNDGHAAEVIRIVRELGLRVPEDVAVIGWDNSNTSRITMPQITTTETGLNQFIAYVGNALVDIARGQHPDERLFPVRLVVNGST